MSNKVFVRGFDFGTTESQVQAHCESCGVVESVELFGKGSAVVTYSTEDAAQSAIATLDKSKIEGNSRYVEVKLDEGAGAGRKKSERGGRKRNGGGGGGGGMNPQQMMMAQMQMMMGNPQPMMQMMQTMMGGGWGGGNNRGEKRKGEPEEQGFKNKFVNSVQLIITKNHQRNMNRDDTEWQTAQVEDAGKKGYQCTVTITDKVGPEGDKTFTGNVCSSQRDAENSAAEIAYNSMKDIFEPLEEEHKAKKQKREEDRKAERAAKKAAEEAEAK